ncbi:MAG: enolase C-terminal domain-like protein, partial [Clostridia bacterium]
MPDRTDLIYRYDGTLKGLLCCVYECFSSKENPMMILPKDEMQLMLLPEKVIETDPAIALRVANAITGKLSEEFMRFVASAHLCATFADLSWDTELFGPLLLTQEILREPLVYRDFMLQVPTGPGLGVQVDTDKL